jgi:hypothetical protein
VFAYLHFRIRRFAAARVVSQIGQLYAPGVERERLRQALAHNTGPWHNLFRKSPVGWNNRCRKRLQQVIAEANQYVQTLNDTFTDPSGDMTPEEKVSPPLAAVSPISSSEEAPTVEEPEIPK